MKLTYTIPKGGLDGIEVFVRVAERRSFRAAALDLGVSASAVSQAIRALEMRLGVTLFARTTRSVGLTEAGVRFLAGVRPAFDAIVEASASVRDLGGDPSGLLRLTAPRAAVSLVVQPLLASFCRAYPRVTIEIDANEDLHDLPLGGFDAGLRLGEFIVPDMVAIRLTPPFRFPVVGSPAYLAERGRPAAPADLAQHACIRVRRANGSLAPWQVRGNLEPMPVAVSGPLIVSDYPAAMGGAEAGVGLAQVPEPLAMAAMADGRLEEVLTAWSPSTEGVFLYFPARAQVMPKLRAFIDHARAFLPWRASLR